MTLKEAILLRKEALGGEATRKDDERAYVQGDAFLCDSLERRLLGHNKGRGKGKNGFSASFGPEVISPTRPPRTYVAPPNGGDDSFVALLLTCLFWNV